MKKTKVIEEYRETLHDLADAVVEEQREEYAQELEPFDQYALRVKSRIYEDMDRFRERFFAGYQALIEELER